MADTPLTRDGPVSVPLDYTVPNGGELLPLTVEATIDGTSAGQLFYAVVQIIDPSGRSMGKYRSDPIAAGGSADVTWFPNVTSKPFPAPPSTNVVAFGYGTSFVSAVGTDGSFGSGTDLLATPLSFAADGISNYLLHVVACSTRSNTTTSVIFLVVNLDSNPEGVFYQTYSPNATTADIPLDAGGVMLAPAAGAHTVNARLVSGPGGTATIPAGTGGIIGPGTGFGPLYVAVELLPH